MTSWFNVFNSSRGWMLVCPLSTFGVESLKPGDFSDVGNSKKFIEFVGHRLKFCDALGWLTWDGRRFEPNDHAALGLATDFTDQMLQEAKSAYIEASTAFARISAECTDAASEATQELAAAKERASAAKSFLTFAGQTRRLARISAFLELSKPELALPADRFDSDPFILNCQSGMIDLRSGQLSAHDPGKLCTKLAPFSPSADGASIWADFLDLITLGDDGLKGFLQQAAGMAAIGKVFHEGILLAVGGGRNGKSTFFNTLCGALGDYAGSVDAQILTTERQNRGAAYATLRGRRLVVCGELEEGQRLSISVLKKLASVDDLVIEEKFRQPEKVKPSHHICLFSNFLPKVSSTDAGTWRRLTVIPFDACMPSGSKDVPNYADKLLADAGGAILTWVVEGARLFCANGCHLAETEAVADATERYQSGENWLQNFIDERCIKDGSFRVGARELYTAYRDWAQSVGDYMRRERDFAGAMEMAGFKKIAPKNRKTWLGLRLETAHEYPVSYSNAI